MRQRQILDIVYTALGSAVIISIGTAVILGFAYVLWFSRGS